MKTNQLLLSLPTISLIEDTHGRISIRDRITGASRCGSGTKGYYETWTHFYALIFILLLSTFACGFPLLTRKASKRSDTATLIFLSQHFGTGVLIATAFVHLLPTAFMSLTHPCLGSLFSRKYPSLAGLIAMLSALSVVGLEMYLTMRGGKHSHSLVEVRNKSNRNRNNGKNATLSQAVIEENQGPSFGENDFSLQDMDSSQRLLTGRSSSFTSPSQIIVQIPIFPETNETENMNYLHDEIGTTISSSFSKLASMENFYEEHNQRNQATSEVHQKRQILQCLMLEAGILFHSVFIGMALSVAIGPPFVVFLIAISFHQSFEGLALGSRIAAIQFPPNSPKPWLMVLAYGFTTPFGQGIGILMHSMYDPESATGLLIVGVMNAISSGLLLYAGLVQLLAEDFLSQKSYEMLKGKKRIKAFSSVTAGALLMAIVGAWA